MFSTTEKKPMQTFVPVPVFSDQERASSEERAQGMGTHRPISLSPTVHQMNAQAPESNVRPSSQPSGESCSPTHEEIARRAYDIYVAAGRMPGHCAENWLRAEQSLREQDMALHPAKPTASSPFSPFREGAY